ncbi:hypothetical protein [Aureimonas phyllosphaerae]|uniref:Lipoprotein n=1 Tax=Aureimonas phyllosphaerae TaxID=1166078 RepID=A0A7W6BS19_9HYPH|nr:hypothetical protein [Aureimonas phyllosphaerae]MBB3935255.1 hypothetical protein [Aureimonas phyllosphaerae]MBB3959263.1 hypothetical protein [Aureimonas phyllosphaerae]
MNVARVSTLSLALTALLIAAGCASRAPAPEKPAPRRADTGLDRMERLTLTANRCWFKSKDPAFASYSIAPELSSFSGRPRFLLVPRGRLEARPLLVVEGAAGSTEVETYGPLLDTSLRTRLEGDLARWRAGSTACNA